GGLARLKINRLINGLALAYRTERLARLAQWLSHYILNSDRE
ncbi:9294_t:CDS:2, partial [Gigaspora rosea]